MTGHSPEPVVAAIRRPHRAAGRHDDHAAHGGRGRGRGRARPSLRAAATGSSRSRRPTPTVVVLRMRRQIQRRPYVLVFSRCYHGSVDETVIVVGPDGRPASKPGNVGPPGRPDRDDQGRGVQRHRGAARGAGAGDVACVLTEPALTNIGIVLPEPGFLEEVEEVCRRDRHAADHRRDAHVLGRARAAARRLGLQPDIVIIGKSIAGGMPIGAYGCPQPLPSGSWPTPTPTWSTRRRRRHARRQRPVDGGRARDARAGAHRRRVRPHDRARHALPRGREEVLDKHDVPWTIVQLGARAEYRFARHAPRSGAESAAAARRRARRVHASVHGRTAAS